MLYPKNSLVILSIIFFFLFFTIASAEDNGFIFPKKKIIIIKPNVTEKGNVKISKNSTSINLPQRNPAQQRKRQESIKKSSLIKGKEVTKNINPVNLPKKKPFSKNTTKTKNEIKPFLESVTQNQINQIKEKNNLKTTKKIVRSKNTFLYGIFLKKKNDLNHIGNTRHIYLKQHKPYLMMHNLTFYMKDQAHSLFCLQ